MCNHSEIQNRKRLVESMVEVHLPSIYIPKPLKAGWSEMLVKMIIVISKSMDPHLP